MDWKIKEFKKPDFHNSVLLVGLPGIGNVGKIVADFLVDELKAKKICEFFSYHMPHSVFVKEDNLIELPKISLYKSNNLLILAGDAQPTDEQSCYSFCDKLLDYLQGNSEIITLGGIGLQGIPKIPKIYCTGNDKDLIAKYIKDTEIRTEIYGVVGPIIGVSGLLLGLAGKRKIPAVTFLAETLGHPMYLGLKGARELLKILNMKLNLNVDLKNLEKEIDELESRMKISDDLGKVSKRKHTDVSYIG